MKNLNYGIIGNSTSAALISKKGSIDWFCLPRFDSSSVFAHLLDNEVGGSMGFEVPNLILTKQKYIPKTNLLKTTFISEKGIFEVIDFMPRYQVQSNGYYCPPDLIRYIRVLEGHPIIKIKFDPRLEYGKNDTIIQNRGRYIYSYIKEPYDSFYLYSDLSYDSILKQKGITLTKGEEHFILMSYNQKLLEQTVDRNFLKLERTRVYWLEWSEKTNNYPLYYDQILRSALTLKLLSFQKSGAIIAALTTSIPETIGEVRNWDYRYCWIRDGSMVVRVLTQLGHFNVADRYMHYIINILPRKDESLQIMYGITGEKELTETFLEHLKGYKNSKPVRIGNAAYKQKQNDIYGILMDAIYFYFKKYPTSLDYSEELWTIVRHIVRAVSTNWHKTDSGIWELRTEKKHFTFSKVLCWVAIDRAQKIAELLQQNKYAQKWKEIENEIRDEIEQKAWNEKKQAYTQSYGSDDLDASVLLMERYGFIDPKNEKFKKTVYTLEKELDHDGLMFRYKNRDDFGKPKSAFTICSFWLTRALYMIGEKENAKKRFEKLLSYSNHLGLFSEDLDFETKEQLGNFPQAYSHLAIIEMAITMSEQEKPSQDKAIETIIKSR